jgi:hypothetical protein
MLVFLACVPSARRVSLQGYGGIECVHSAVCSKSRKYCKADRCHGCNLLEIDSISKQDET